MKAVVIGGAGFLGSHLIEYLIKKEYPLLCLDREGCDTSFLDGLGVPVTACDVMRSETVAPHIERGDYVFHLAAFLGKASVSREQYYGLNVDAAEQMCRTAVERGAAKFIFPSSMAAMGPVGSPERPMDEETECRPQTMYGKTKLEAERRITTVVEEGSSGNGIGCVILRPPPFFGARMNPITSSALLFEKMQQKKFLLIGDTQNYFPLCYVKNLAAAMVDLAEKTREGVHTFVISDGPPVKFHDILMTLRREIGINKKIYHLPYGPVHALASGFETAGKIFRFTPLLTTDIVDGMAKSLYYHDISRAQAAGYRPPYTLEEGIRETVEEMGLRKIVESQGR